ncbi:MAG TPA: hypothetical protein VGC66_00130 [Pyrinomonadaceae bacterium]
MSGQPYSWTVNSLGEVWTLYPQGGGSLMSPAGQDFAFEIAVALNGTAWVISTEARQGGAVIQGLPPGDQWIPIPAPAAATKVAVDPNGNLWTVNEEGQVWFLYQQGGGYMASPPGEDFAMEISVAPDSGAVWIVSTDTYDDGNVLKRWDPNSQTWIALPAPAAADKVAVGPNGIIWTVNYKGEVWMLYPQGGGALMSPPGTDFAQAIGVGPDGTVWVISNEPREGGSVVMVWSGENQIWNPIPAPAAAVAVAGAVQS